MNIQVYGFQEWSFMAIMIFFFIARLFLSTVAKKKTNTQQNEDELIQEAAFLEKAKKSIERIKNKKQNQKPKPIENQYQEPKIVNKKSTCLQLATNSKVQSFPFGDIKNPETLKKAFIYKTILERPQNSLKYLHKS